MEHLNDWGWLSGVLIFSALTFITSFLFSISTYAWPVDSYQELRYEHVRGQNTLSSCGPASLATLFAEFYGMETGEKEITELVKPYLEKEIEKLKEGKLPEGGVSMLDLKKVSQELEIPARGYKIPKRKVFSIMRKLKTPLLVHLDKPEDHFVLGVAGFHGQIVLADPSWGIRSLGKKEFFNKWDGLILAFSPPTKYKNWAHRVIKKVRQRAKQRDRTQTLSRRFLWDR